jgi:hypothetical protein
LEIIATAFLASTTRKTIAIINERLEASVSRGRPSIQGQECHHSSSS